jgi:catechol-2,3-dioxygenase
MPTQPKAGAVLFAKDVARLAAFYAQVLAVVPKHAEAEKVVIEAEDFLLVIHAIPPAVAARVEIASPPALRENMPVKLFLPVRSLAQARLSAQSQGGGMKPAEAEWSAADFRACDGFDPEGNVVQFREALREAALAG